LDQLIPILLRIGFQQNLFEWFLLNQNKRNTTNLLLHYIHKGTKVNHVFGELAAVSIGLKYLQAVETRKTMVPSKMMGVVLEYVEHRRKK
jgi:hypothetical protein